MWYLGCESLSLFKDLKTSYIYYNSSRFQTQNIDDYKYKKKM